MKIAIGADHAGFAAKEEIKTVIKALGHTVVDQGTTGETSVDYPDFAEKVARAVASGEVDRGVLLCAAVIGDEKTAALSRQHNDANVFCAGSRITPVVKIAESLKVWLQTPFEGGRHQNRVGKISAIEKNR